MGQTSKNTQMKLADAVEGKVFEVQSYWFLVLSYYIKNPCQLSLKGVNNYLLLISYPIIYKNMGQEH